MVVAKWLEQPSRNLMVSGSNPPVARAFFFYQWQSVLNQVPQGRCIFAVFPLITALADLPEAKQALIKIEDFFKV